MGKKKIIEENADCILQLIGNLHDNYKIVPGTYWSRKFVSSFYRLVSSFIETADVTPFIEFT